MKLDVKADIKAVERSLNDTQRKRVPQATSRALNRAVTKVRTDTRREVSKEMGVQQKRIKGAFNIAKSSKTMLVATLAAVGRPIKLIYFKGTRQLKRGVKSGAYNNKKVYPGTFITTVGAGHRGAFKRKGDRRLPIKELYGPSVPKAMAEDKIQKKMQKTGRETFLKELNRQLKKVLR